MTGYSETVKRLWNDWQLSGLVLWSLFLQLVLILTAQSRKTKPYKERTIFYWLFYLGGSYVATYCLGIISQDASCKDKATDPSTRLKAFWAPILLFHLGGLDDFTALTLEDNQLWLRHAAGLFLQAATTVYIFFRYLPVGGYRGLLFPFIFIFLAASTKCFERAWALRKGSMEGLRESMLGKPEPGPDYADVMDRYVGKLRCGVPPLLNINEEFRLPATSMVVDANPYVPVPTAVTVDDSSTPNSSLQSSTTSSQFMRPSSSSSIYISDSVPAAYEFFMRSKYREPTELASQLRSSNFLSSSGVNSSSNTETMIASSSKPHGSIHHPSLATEVKGDGVTQHHHSTPEPSLPSSSSTDPSSTAIQIIEEEPQRPDSPQNSSQAPPSTAMETETTEDTTAKKSKDTFDVIPKAYELFLTFKGVLVDGIFSFKEREESRALFLALSCYQAFDVIETELSFAYDVLYTKASISRTRVGAAIIRVLSLVLTVSTVLLFAFHAVTIDEFLPRHRCVTYVLLAGAVFVDITTLLQFIWSDWSFVDGCWHNKKKFVSNRRWSNLMSQYNLINFCLKELKLVSNARWLDFFVMPTSNRRKYLIPSAFNKILGIFGLKESWDRYRYTGFVPVDDQLKKFLFTELWLKANEAKTTKDYKPYITCRGDWALKENRLNELRWCVQEADFDESLLIWHIATNLRYQSEKDLNRHSEEVAMYSEMARRLSDYMLYLLVVRPLMLSSSTIMGTKRFRDTCAEVKKYFERYASVPDERTAHAMLLGVETPLRPIIVKGDKSKSVLWDGCILAKQLKLVDPPEKRWEIMCEVWVEMLCYAGIHCGGYYHAEQLREGGELLTFACFLMTHLGMGKHYKIEIGDATANFQPDEE